MTLNLTVTNPDTDYGRYQCVCKNELGTTRGEVNVFGSSHYSIHINLE